MEFTFHLIIWCSAVLYSLYNLFLFTKRIDSSITDSTEDFEVGWVVIGRLKDVSDKEWTTWKIFAIVSYPWHLSHFCGAELFRQNNYYPQIWYIFVSFAFILHKFGLTLFCVLIVQPLIYLLILQLGGKSRSIWICSCLLLVMINFLKAHYNYLFILAYEYNYMMMVAVLWVHLRCLSFSLETIGTTQDIQVKPDKTITSLQILNMLSYTFYLPVLFLGPIILYNDFLKSFNTPYKSSLKRRIFCFASNLARYVGWFFFTEFSLHFMYFNALQYYPEVIEIMSDWSLYGSGLWMGLYFYLKYLVVYGLSGTLAALDHVEPETPPRCIARVHRYSQMWKYFDSGLHKFLIRYIYMPVMQGFVRGNVMWSVMRVFASLVCFTFVFFWHGAQTFIFIWTVLNYLGIVMEGVGTSMSQSALYARWRGAVLTEPMNSRFNALLATPILIMSALSNFYFFAGYEVGNIYVNRVFNQSLNSLVVLFICLYSSCRVSQSLHNLGARNILT